MNEEERNSANVSKEESSENVSTKLYSEDISTPTRRSIRIQKLNESGNRDRNDNNKVLFTKKITNEKSTKPIKPNIEEDGETSNSFSQVDAEVADIQPICDNIFQQNRKERNFLKRDCLDSSKLNFSTYVCNKATLPNEDVSKVFKIISKPNILTDITTESKSSSKPVLKTYSNKRRNFQKNDIVESFGLPDHPIAPGNVQPIINYELDVTIQDTNEITILNMEYSNEPWIISTDEEDLLPILEGEVRKKSEPIQESFTKNGSFFDFCDFDNFIEPTIFSSTPLKSGSDKALCTLNSTTRSTKIVSKSKEIDIEAIKKNFKKMLSRADVSESIMAKKNTVLSSKKKNSLVNSNNSSVDSDSVTVDEELSQELRVSKSNNTEVGKVSKAISKHNSPSTKSDMKSPTKKLHVSISTEERKVMNLGKNKNMPQHSIRKQNTVNKEKVSNEDIPKKIPETDISLTYSQKNTSGHETNKSTEEHCDATGENSNSTNSKRILRSSLHNHLKNLKITEVKKHSTQESPNESIDNINKQLNEFRVKEHVLSWSRCEMETENSETKKIDKKSSPSQRQPEENENVSKVNITKKRNTRSSGDSLEQREKSIKTCNNTTETLNQQVSKVSNVKVTLEKCHYQDEQNTLIEDNQFEISHQNGNVNKLLLPLKKGKKSIPEITVVLNPLDIDKLNRKSENLKSKHVDTPTTKRNLRSAKTVADILKVGCDQDDKCNESNVDVTSATIKEVKESELHKNVQKPCENEEQNIKVTEKTCTQKVISEKARRKQMRKVSKSNEVNGDISNQNKSDTADNSVETSNTDEENLLMRNKNDSEENTIETTGNNISITVSNKELNSLLFIENEQISKTLDLKRNKKNGEDTSMEMKLCNGNNLDETLKCALTGKCDQLKHCDNFKPSDTSMVKPNLECKETELQDLFKKEQKIDKEDTFKFSNGDPVILQKVGIIISEKVAQENKSLGVSDDSKKILNVTLDETTVCSPEENGKLRNTVFNSVTEDNCKTNGTTQVTIGNIELQQNIENSPKLATGHNITKAIDDSRENLKENGFDHLENNLENGNKTPSNDGSIEIISNKSLECESVINKTSSINLNTNIERNVDSKSEKTLEKCHGFRARLKEKRNKLLGIKPVPVDSSTQKRKDEEHVNQRILLPQPDRDFSVPDTAAVETPKSVGKRGRPRKSFILQTPTSHPLQRRYSFSQPGRSAIRKSLDDVDLLNRYKAYRAAKLKRSRSMGSALLEGNRKRSHGSESDKKNDLQNKDSPNRSKKSDSNKNDFDNLNLLTRYSIYCKNKLGIDNCRSVGQNIAEIRGDLNKDDVPKNMETSQSAINGEKPLQSDINLATDSTKKVLDKVQTEASPSSKKKYGKDRGRFKIGDLAWAQIGYHPFWPCLITNEPGTRYFIKIIQSKRFMRELYHVRFFGDNGKRAWISKQQIIEYSNKDDLEILREKIQSENKVIPLAYIIRPKTLSKWNGAIEEAEQFKSKPVAERLNFFTNALYKHNSPKPKIRLNTAQVPKEISSLEQEKSSENKNDEAKKDANNVPNDAKRRSSENTTISSTVERTGSENLVPANVVSKDVTCVDNIQKEQTNTDSPKETCSPSPSKRKSNEKKDVCSELIVTNEKEVPSVSIASKDDVLPSKRKSNEHKNISEDNVTEENQDDVVLSVRLKYIKQRNRSLDNTTLAKRRLMYIKHRMRQKESTTIIPNGTPSNSDPSKHIEHVTADSILITKRKSNEHNDSQTAKNTEQGPFKPNLTRASTVPSISTKRRSNELRNVLLDRNSPRNSNELKKNDSQFEILRNKCDSEEKISTLRSQKKKTSTRSENTPDNLSLEGGEESCRMQDENSQSNENFLSRIRIRRQVDEISEVASKSSSDNVVDSDITSNSMETQKVLYKRNNLFKGISREKVCQYCYKPTEVLKCRGRCNGSYHISCSLKIVKEVVSKRGRPPNTSNNTENHIISRNEDNDKPTTTFDEKLETSHTDATFKQSEVDESCPKEDPSISSLREEEQVQIITVPSSVYNTPPRKTFPPDFKNMTLAEQIDYKMKEIMRKFESSTFYSESTSSESSSEDISRVQSTQANDEKNQEKNVSKSETNEANKNSISAALNSTKKLIDSTKVDKPDVKKLTPVLKKKVFIKHVTADSERENVLTDDKLEEVKKNFKCGFCVSDLYPYCFVCHRSVSKKGSSIRQKCSVYPCGRFYHPECLKMWPQTQWSLIQTTRHKDSDKDMDSFVCPLHVCHTCVSDDPRAATSRCSGDKIVKCLRCPSTYHSSNLCVPAGTTILSSSQIICPRHRGTSKLFTINTTWCFLCSKGGNLICCETCPTSVHPECLPVNLTDDDKFICEDCESGRLPLYDEIVWVKLGKFRWWPALILFPNEVPDNIKNMKHGTGEFVVKFFGTYDYYWVNRGRSFLFQEGDTSQCSSVKKKVDLAFNRAVDEAVVAHKLKKEFKLSQEVESISSLKPPPYIRIKVNKPVGNVRHLDLDLSSTNACECDPNKPHPCGPESDCLNRLLMTECNPDVCPAGPRCKNQSFEKREYPPLVPYKTQGRGWGLKTLAPIKKGQFVIEYVGELIDSEEYQRRIQKMHEQKEENYYFLTIDKDRMIDAGPKGNVARFMNHCCQPNCETQKWTVNGDTRVGLFATVDIPTETELTFNYNLECVGKEKKVCRCGAPNCSGFIGVKAKQQDPDNITKRPKKTAKKKEPEKPIVLPPCFICGKKKGIVIGCNNKICNKAYHRECLNTNDQIEDSKFICPWHNCNLCSKRTIRCCIKCTNSFCPSHADGNIRYHNLFGFVCTTHDPTTPPKEVRHVKLKKKRRRMVITEETAVTSTTSDHDETDDWAKRPAVSKPIASNDLESDNDLSTSKLLTRDLFSDCDSQDEGAVSSATLSDGEERISVKRKRGRPKKVKRSRKRIKLDHEENIGITASSYVDDKLRNFDNSELTSSCRDLEN